jgi:ribosome-binding ATPase YchF (GTP1/OBG family)
MTKIHNHVSQDLWLKLLPLDEHEENAIAGYNFVTRKPLLVVLNTGETGEIDLPTETIKAFCADQSWEFLSICGSLEEEIAQLAPDDQNDFLSELGVEESASLRFIHRSYALLNLISFFTVGENEVRSWPIKRGTMAHKAAGKIHSDIERGFIRAEVIGYEDFIQCGDFANARKKGLMKLEGKEYQVRDGDIVFFRFNV